MYAQIIAIGDEILIGQTLDTNSQYIAKKLTHLGLEVLSIQTIPDHKKSIVEAMNNAQADIVLCTGGLGPTQDDITKKTIAEFFDSPLVMNASVLENIQQLLLKIGRKEINELNRQQALVPEKATVLNNKVGTAPGLWLEKNKRIYVYMPGIPFEMKYLLNKQVLPRIQKILPSTQIFRRNVMVYSIPESELALRLENWEKALPENFSVAYLPTSGIIKMRLTFTHPDSKTAQKVLDSEIHNLQFLLGDKIISTEGEDLPTLIGALLQKYALTLSTAESFTSGRIVTMLTSVSGSSGYIKGGIVPYQVSVKEKVLGVSSKIISEYTAVSAETAEAMAEHAQQLFDSDVALSTTGVAGPTTDAQHLHIGKAFVTLRMKDRNYTKEFNYPNLEREEFTQLISLKALEFLLKFLSEGEK